MAKQKVVKENQSPLEFGSVPVVSPELQRVKQNVEELGLHATEQHTVTAILMTDNAKALREVGAYWTENNQLHPDYEIVIRARLHRYTELRTKNLT